MNAGDIAANDHMIVYINWDGFAWHYYKAANEGDSGGTPVINGLVKEGVLFADACTGIPSITNPMQTAIVTGAWPRTTGNCWQYFERSSRKLLRMKRENKAETLAEALVRQDFHAISIHQFSLENRGTFAGSEKNPYIRLGNHADYADRFEEAVRCVKKLGKQNDGSGLPALLAIYMDDLDGIGHNSWFTYGAPPVRTEERRLENIIARLKLMDAKLGEFIQACRDAGIYEKLSFLLISDHGMTPYGRQAAADDGYGYSKLPELVNLLKGLGFKTEVLSVGKRLKKDTEIALAAGTLEVQLFFMKEVDKAACGRIIAELERKDYVGVVMDKAALRARGAADEFADLLISPKPPYHFSNDKKLHRAGGQHDSLDTSSQRIFALMWGKGIKKDLYYNKKVYVTDFAGTLSALLGVEGPRDSTGRILTDALEIPFCL